MENWSRQMTCIIVLCLAMWRMSTMSDRSYRPEKDWPTTHTHTQWTMSLPLPDSRESTYGSSITRGDPAPSSVREILAFVCAALCSSHLIQNIRSYTCRPTYSTRSAVGISRYPSSLCDFAAVPKSRHLAIYTAGAHDRSTRCVL